MEEVFTGENPRILEYENRGFKPDGMFAKILPAF
jgi:hypothetical protein